MGFGTTSADLGEAVFHKIHTLSLQDTLLSWEEVVFAPLQETFQNLTPNSDLRAQSRLLKSDVAQYQ